MKLAIDFDGVIHEGQRPDNRMGLPIAGAQRNLRSLKDQGHSIIIFTVRANTRSGFDAVCKWLDYFEIPWDTVTAVKPNADLYIDDRGYRFRTWRRFAKEFELIQRGVYEDGHFVDG